MPVYNAGDFLAEAIESILNQTYQNLELVVIDDASKDESLKIILNYKKIYPQKIRVLRIKKNLNMGGDAAGNLGYKRAKGKFVARMDADDIAMPNRIEKQVKYLLSHPELFAVGSNAYVINKEGILIGEKKMPDSNEKIYKNFFVFHPLIHPTLMFRKSILKEEGLYTLKYEANNDYLTFFRLITQGYRFANLSDKLLLYRFHGKNDSLTKVKSRFVNSLKIRQMAVKDFGYKPNMAAVFKLLGQILVVFLLPEKVIVPVYLAIRGISNPFFAKLNKRNQYVFEKAINF